MGKLKALLQDEPTMDAVKTNAEDAYEFHSLMEIAVTRSWVWMQEYDPVSGQVTARSQPWANEARHAFIDGFMEGFQAKFFEQTDTGVE